MGNSIMIEGKEGIVIIDTTESLTAAKYERDTERERYIQGRECGVIMEYEYETMSGERFIKQSISLSLLFCCTSK